MWQPRLESWKRIRSHSAPVPARWSSTTPTPVTVFDTAISGYGIVSHLAGVTILSADSSGFTGDTYVDDGALAITGQFGGSFSYIGGDDGSAGTATVSGDGSSWTLRTTSMSAFTALAHL